MPRGQARATVATLTLTKNEAVNLRKCLRSLDGLPCRKIVVDSGSIDDTLAVAREFGAEVWFKEYVTEASSLNWALERLREAVDWVLILDADEELTPGLRRELASIPPPDDSTRGYYIRREMRFLRKPILHGGYQRNLVLRLVDPRATRVVELTRTLGYVDVKGPTRRLRHPMIHENLRPLTDWILKHDLYAQREAEDRITGLNGPSPVTEGKARVLLHRYVLSRFPKLLLPISYFIYRYLLRGGFLDGTTGLIYFTLHDLWYPTLIVGKMVELEKKL